MIHNQAKKLATVLEKMKIIDDTSHEVYVYGLELMISTLINILLIAIISITLRRYYDWLLFLAAFIPLRTTAGGYHAKSHLKCIIVGALLFSICLVISQLQIAWIYIIPIIAGFSLIVVLLFSPVEAQNKKLKNDRNKQNRRISISIAITNISIVITIFFFNELICTLNIYYLGVLSAALSMLVVKANKSEGGGEHENCEKLVV